MIRILLAEDQAMVRGALATLLGVEPDFEVVGQAGDGREALQLAQELAPDVVLLDIEMPGMSGIEAAAAIHQEVPGCAIIILTTFGRPGYLKRAMDAGAMGYVVKDAPAEELADTIRRVVAGERVVHPSLALAALTDGEGPLSEREKDVLRLCGRGATVEEIAEELHLSQGTVRNYLSEAIQKLGARNRVEAARIAEEKGWL